MGMKKMVTDVSVVNSTEYQDDYVELFTWNALFIFFVSVISLMVLSTITVNSLIIICVQKFKRLQIPANYILINLSVADCGVAVASCFYLLTDTVISEDKEQVACMISLSFMFLMCSASLLSLALIAFDRFSALVKPLTYSSRLTNMRILVYSIFIWVYAVVITGSSVCIMILWDDKELILPSMEDGGLVPTVFPEAYSYLYYSQFLCYSKKSTNFALISQISLIFFPAASVMFYCYGRVMLVARHHSRAISAVQGNLRQTKFNKTYGMFRGKKYFLTLTSILGVFTITWVFLVVLTFLDVFCEECFKNGLIPHSYFCILALLNTAINPWIYACRSQDFKAGFVRFFKSIKSCCSGERPPSTRQRRDSRFSDGLSRTNSMIGNMQHLQALYSDAYYNQKNQNNSRPRTLPMTLGLQTVSHSVQSIQPKPVPFIKPRNEPLHTRKPQEDSVSSHLPK